MTGSLLERPLSLALIEEALLIQQRSKFARFFPDKGPFRRELYVKHMEFFKAGAKYPERLFCAANRVGKTEGIGYEVTAHLTGDYPHWWEGRRFDGPVEAWACNNTWDDVRDINQNTLVGPPKRMDRWGTGMIPFDKCVKISKNPHVKDGVESVLVRHKSGGISELQFKAYQQGREAFQGRAKHVIWADEEVPLDVYTEMLLRTLTTKGIIAIGYTPIYGLTELTLGFMPGGQIGPRG